MASSNKVYVRVRATRFWSPLRVVLTLVVFALLVALGLSSCNSAEAPNANAPANRTAASSSPGARNDAAPSKVPPSAPPLTAYIPLPQDLRDTKLQTIDGESLKLSDYKDKVVIVNFWAVWCGPCRLEMPELVKMSNEYKSRGLVVLGVATAFREDQTQVKEYIRAQSIPYKILWDGGALEAPLVELVNGHGVIPQSFVISRDGRIVKHFEGFSQYSTPMLMRQAVEDALNGKA